VRTLEAHQRLRSNSESGDEKLRGQACRWLLKDVG
jgi:hypothetical protein